MDYWHAWYSYHHTTNAYAWGVSITCMCAPCIQCVSHNITQSFTCGAWLIHMCDMTHPHVRHDSLISDTWLIDMCVRAMHPTYLTWDALRRIGDEMTRYLPCDALYMRLYTYVDESWHMSYHSGWEMTNVQQIHIAHAKYVMLHIQMSHIKNKLRAVLSENLTALRKCVKNSPPIEYSSAK